MDGLLALDLWTSQTYSPQETGAIFVSTTKTQHIARKQKIDRLSELGHVHTNTHSSQRESQLYNFLWALNLSLKMVIK